MTTAAEILARHGLTQLADEIQQHIVQQRWFGGRERSVTGVEIIDVGEIRADDPVCLFVVAQVSYAEGAPTLFNLPLGLRRLPHAMADVNPQYRIDTIEHEGHEWAVYDAFADNDCSFELWRLMATGGEIETALGRLRGATGSDLDLSGGATDIRLLPGEMSNTSLVRGSSEFFKWSRRIESGASVEDEMVAALQRGGFAAMATPLGGVDYIRDRDQPLRIGFLQTFLPNATEGWALALTSLRDLYAGAEEDDQSASATVAAQGASFLAEAARLGRVTADMHLALASDALEGDMRALPVEQHHLDHWADQMTAELDRLLNSSNPRLQPLRERREAISARYEALRSTAPGGVAIRIHGDYHLGQVMRTDEGWVVLDFEGEPARPVEERRVHSSPLRDVAGMLRSFDYAAAAALAERTTPHDPLWTRLLQSGHAWAAANRDAFWRAYLDRLHATAVLPADDGALTIRRAFELQKALYEITYELGHRPDWVDIPLNFLMRETS